MIKAVLFDLDGTLADTAKDLGEALNRLLIEYGKPTQTYQAIRPIASHGARGLIHLGFGIDKDHPDFPTLRKKFLDYYDQCFCDKTDLFDGIAEMIQAIDQHGCQWGIITNKPQKFTNPLIPTLGFPIPPAVIVSGDTVGEAKPSVKPMLYATKQIQVSPEECLYVGDAARDMEAGKKVGMTTMLVNWGYICPSEKPETWQADIRIDTPSELIQYLK